MDEQMSDYQFRTFLRLILELLKGSKDLDDAIKKIENLLSDRA